MSPEELARELHEAGREAVEKGCIVRRDVPSKGFIEWDDLDEAAREGRMIQARYLLAKYDIIDRIAASLGLFRCAARTELKEKVPDVSEATLLYLNYAVTQAYSLGRAGSPLTERECCGSCSEPGVLLDPEERE